ncbi:putative HTH-type transcriptional regulator YcnC [Thalassotalea insulae]|uniref:HTH-type transcriptional regulator YcnC n=1 Tax=Thalassotalea insulae TaxID=2056778 RepID=A0ABQ6GPT3_9GAMM|nr:TetR/AcrR family transcriptional regulator [Thalassotalea insulae]GLX77937.1 putative HTH-type transcriptional regulator YcnC [Thalassotalea insulae]
MSQNTRSKRDLIMATAKSLFIEKGFRGTTIAGIAEAAGIAKGSVYSYFTSKLDIVKALFLQSDEKNQLMVEQLLLNEKSKGKGLLEQYLTTEFQEVLNERSFIQVFLTDDMVIMDSEVMAVVQECRINYHLSQQKVLLQAYGEHINPWLYDIVSLVNGLLQEYTVFLTLDNANFSIKRCAQLVTFCLDSAIVALSHSDIEPLLTAKNFPLIKHTDIAQIQSKKALQLIESIKLEANDMPKEQQQLVLETTTLIETELAKAESNNTLIRALIANLRPYNELNSYRKRLAEALDVELI